MGLREVLQTALAELVALTGCRPAGVRAAARQGDGWRLRVELVERPGVPDSMDVLGLYEVQADGDGHVVAFARKALRRRGELDEGLEEAGQELPL